MDNLILNHRRNSTLSSCGEPYTTVYSWLNNILLFSSFPASVIVIVKLLIRGYEKRSFSPAEVFLLQISITNVSLCLSHLLLVLVAVNVCQFSRDTFPDFLQSQLNSKTPLHLCYLCALLHRHRPSGDLQDCQNVAPLGMAGCCAHLVLCSDHEFSNYSL